VRPFFRCLLRCRGACAYLPQQAKHSVSSPLDIQSTIFFGWPRVRAKIVISGLAGNRVALLDRRPTARRGSLGRKQRPVEALKALHPFSFLDLHADSRLSDTQIAHNNNQLVFKIDILCGVLYHPSHCYATIPPSSSFLHYPYPQLPGRAPDRGIGDPFYRNSDITIWSATCHTKKIVDDVSSRCTAGFAATARPRPEANIRQP